MLVEMSNNIRYRFLFLKNILFSHLFKYRDIFDRETDTYTRYLRRGNTHEIFY